MGKFGFILLFLICLATSAFTQSFEELYNKAQQHYHQKDLPNAIKFTEQALPLATQKLGRHSENLGNLLSSLGYFYLMDQNYLKAKETYQKVLEIRKIVHGETNMEYLKSLSRLGEVSIILQEFKNAELIFRNLYQLHYQNNENPDLVFTQNILKNLALVYEQQKKYEPADSVYNQLIKLSSQDFAPRWQKSLMLSKAGEYQKSLLLLKDLEKDHLAQAMMPDSVYAQLLADMGDNFYHLEDFKKAEEQHLKSRQIREQAGLTQNFNYSHNLNQLGNIYAELKDYQKSESYLEQCMELRERILGGAKNPYYARVLNDLSRVYYLSEKYRQAETLCRDAIRIQKETIGDRDPDYIISRQNLADILNTTQQFVKAEPIYKSVIKRKGQLYGKQHPDYATSLNNLAELYDAQRLYNLSQGLHQEALAIRRLHKNSNPQAYIRSLRNLANIHIQKKEYEKAEDLFNELLEIAKMDSNIHPQTYAEILYQSANLYYELGRILKAENLLQKASVIYEEESLKNPEVYLQSLENLAAIYKNQGRYSESEELLKKAVSVAQSNFGDESYAYAKALNQLGLLFKTIGFYEEAETKYRQSLVLFENLRDYPESYAQVLRNIASLFKTKGIYAEAEPVYLKSLNIIKDNYGIENPEYAKTLGQLASLYKILGRAEEAEEAYLKVLELQSLTLGEKHPDYALTINNLANLYKSESQSDKAEPLYQRALDIRARVLGKEDPEYATSLDDLAGFYLSQKEFQKALPLYKESQSIRLKVFGAEHPIYAASLNNLALLYENKGDYNQAEENYKQSLQIFQNVLGASHPHYAKTLNNLASLYEIQKRFPESRNLYKQSAFIIIDQINNNFKYLSEEEKRLFYIANKVFLENFINFSIKICEEPQSKSTLAALGDSYNLQLITKGIVLDATTKARKRILSSKDPRLIQKYQQWQNLRQQIAKIHNLGKSEIRLRNIKLDSLVAQANQLEKDLSRASSDFDLAYHDEAPTWKEIQKSLKEDEAAVEIIRLKPVEDQIVYAALILNSRSQENPELVLLKNGKELEEKYYNYYHNVTYYRAQDKHAYELYWKPIKEKLGNVKKLYFSPDGVYNKLNLNSLRNPENDQYLIDELDINLVTNTRHVLSSKTPRKFAPNRNAILVAPDFSNKNSGTPSDTINRLIKNMSNWITRTGFYELPGTAFEIRGIHAILDKNNWKSNYYLDDNASESLIKGLKNPKVLHIATHGFFLESKEGSLFKNKSFQSSNKIKESTYDPMLRSGLILSGAGEGEDMASGQEDGILTAFEATHLELDETELVVLSACETALGRVSNGEGVYGLQRAFQIAGAETILMSLWKVDDNATQELMRVFYEQWLSHGDKKKAFREAQMQVRAKYPDPYYWGAFVMVGR